MKRKALSVSLALFLIVGILAGFSYYDRTPRSTKMGNIPLKSVSPVEKNSAVQYSNGNPIQDGAIIYSDDFNGANDTNALKARGYKVYYRGSTAQGIETWFQGVPGIFPAYNGPPDGYVAANYQVIASGVGTIDSWLVLPKANTGANDSLFFYSRSPLGDTFPDSIRVMYSASGDSVPEAGSWVELGRFKVNIAGTWELKGFRPTAAGVNARYAIRYRVAGGGPGGANSDYIGIDALTIGGQPPPPPVDIVEVGNVYALGKKPTICYDTNYVRVRISHKRAQTDTITLNTKIKNVGGFVKFNVNDIIIMTGVKDSIITRFYLKPDSIKIDSIIATATANGEQATENNKATYLSENTANAYNYAISTEPTDGGVGFTGATGDFVAKFTTNCALPLYAIDLTFDALTGGGNQPYNVLIFGNSGNTPGAVLYTSAPLTSPPGAATPQLVTHNLPSPVTVGPGTFYVGISQTANINIAFGFQNEVPIRNNSFYYRSPVGTGIWTDFSPGADFRLDISPRTAVTLNLTVLIEGFWNAPTNISDTLTVELHSTTAPYELIASDKSVKSASGNLTVSFNAKLNESFYIVIRHRNALETWSKAGGQSVAQGNYNFTTSASQAFGNNLTLKDGKFTIYSGDVNQDGIIDVTDAALVDNDAFNFVGGYVVTDVNGDNIVDLADAAIVDNNSFNFIGVIKP